MQENKVLPTDTPIHKCPTICSVRHDVQGPSFFDETSKMFDVWRLHNAMSSLRGIQDQSADFHLRFFLWRERRKAIKFK
jgi:hypothetical protein